MMIDDFQPAACWFEDAHNSPQLVNVKVKDKEID
jgi:general stress protein 26